jgi:hypothetical protein
MKPRIRTSFYRAKRRYVVQRGHTVHRSGSDWKILGLAGETLKQIGRSAPEPADTNPNWLSYSDLTGDPVPPITRFVSTWKVPGPPTNGGLSIFFFNGLEDVNGDNILQPVLQWGSTAHGAITGSWSIASWYVGGTGSPAFSSEAIPVKPGVELTGTMVFDGTTWTCGFDGYPATSLLVDRLPDMQEAALTLEAYAGNAVPGDVTLRDPVSFRVASLTVAAGADLSQCQWSPFGQWPAIVANGAPNAGQVTIAYR